MRSLCQCDLTRERELCFWPNNKQESQLTFDHVTYLQGASDTLFTNGNTMELYWTEVVANRNNDTQGLLYGYNLSPPHHFRQGSLNFTSWPQVCTPSHEHATALPTMSH